MSNQFLRDPAFIKTPNTPARAYALILVITPAILLAASTHSLAHTTPAHRHIAVQAANIWPASPQSVAGASAAAEYQLHLDGVDTDGLCFGSFLSEGAAEEDECDFIRKCPFSDFSDAGCDDINFSHFWHIDYNPFSTFKGLDLLAAAGAPGKCDLNFQTDCPYASAYYDAWLMWNGASGNYQAKSCGPLKSVSIAPIVNAYYQDKKLGYYILGRVAHLLADMSVPAHVKNDPHYSHSFLTRDSYETYIGDPARFGAYSGAGSPIRAETLTTLFYDLAQTSDYFPSISGDEACSPCACSSDLYCGDTLDENGQIFGSFMGFPTIGSCSGDIAACEGTRCVDDLENSLTAEVLMPAAMRYTAGLYRLFWKATHPAPKNLRGALIGQDMHLEWDPVPTVASYPARYRVYRATTPLVEGEFPPDFFLAEVPAGQTTHVDVGISSGVRYYYAVAGVEGAATLEPGVTRNESLMSNSVAVSNQPPSLSSGGVEPPEGSLTDNTTFVYAVSFRDPENEPASSVRVCVDGVDGSCTFGQSYAMVSTNGRDFTRLLNASEIGTGQHSFFFEAHDAGGLSARTPSAGSFVGPVVSGGTLSVRVLEPDGTGDFVFRPISSLYTIRVEVVPAASGCIPDVSLFYSPIRGVSAPTPIAEHLGPIAELEWNMASVPEGCYFVLAKVSDNCNDADEAWSIGTVCIFNEVQTPCNLSWEQEAVLAPTGTQPDVETARAYPSRVDLVYKDQGVHYRRSTDSGSTWEDPLPISTSSDVDEPELVIDEAEDAHILYQQRSGGSYELFHAIVAKSGGLRFPPIQITASDSEPSGPGEICVASGVAHAVWVERGAANAAIHYSRNPAPYNDPWETPRVLAEDAVRSVNAPTCVAKGSEIYLFYEHPTASTITRLETRKSTDSGMNWASPVLIDQLQKVREPRPTESNGVIHVAFGERTASPDAWIKRSGDGAASWSQDIQLSTTSSTDRVNVDATGNSVFVSWREQSTGAIVVTASADSGATWCTPESGNMQLALSRLTVSPCGNAAQVHLVGEAGGIRYSRTRLCSLPPAVLSVFAEVVGTQITATWLAQDPNSGETVAVDAWIDTDLDPVTNIPLGQGLVNDGTETFDISAIRSGSAYHLCLRARDVTGLRSSYACSSPFPYENPVLSDDDGDGWTEATGDCNDSNATVYPGAVERCDNIDNDCDGTKDGFATICGVGACAAAGTCTSGIDSCVPGHRDLEVCNGLDDDCNGTPDDAQPVVGSPVVTIQASDGQMHLVWSPLVSATGYDAIQGDLGMLASSGGDFSVSTQVCLGDDLPTTSILAAAMPAPGSGFFYVVRGVNCVGRGTYNSAGPSQIGSRDEEIDASSGSCP